MTAQHSPGPWRFTDDGYGEDCEPPEPGKRWLTVETDDEYPDEIAVIVNRVGEPTETQMANARLIVAAPLMLEALRAALAYLESECPHESTDDCTSCALICYDARATIRVATGEDA